MENIARQNAQRIKYNEHGLIDTVVKWILQSKKTIVQLLAHSWMKEWILNMWLIPYALLSGPDL